MRETIRDIGRLQHMLEHIDRAEQLSSPTMADILRQGQKDIQQGKGKAVKIEELWK